MDYIEFKQKTDDSLKHINQINEQLWQGWKDLLKEVCKIEHTLRQFETHPYYKRQLQSEIDALKKCWRELNCLSAAIQVARSTLSIRAEIEPNEATHKLLEKKEADGRSNDDK